MKQVTFNTSTPIKQYSMDNLKDAVIIFLAENGIGYGNVINYVSINAGEIHISCTCANSQFTRAIALFQLIFSESNVFDVIKDAQVPGYIVYSSLIPGFVLRLRFGGNTSENIKNTINYINDHMLISVI